MRLSRENCKVNRYDEKILQFGEGNFLRAFVDWIIYKMNGEANFNSGVTVIQPIREGLSHLLNEQDGLYTLYLNGLKNGKPVREKMLIDCINTAINPYDRYDQYLETALNPNIRFIISNTTEAGITYNKQDNEKDCPPKSFPGKLTAWLYKRYEAGKKGVIIMPCELIDRNGDKLKKIVLNLAQDWGKKEAFMRWIKEENFFCNSLVDRIVPGFPKEQIKEILQELGYDDKLVVEGEQFHLWVIEAPDWVKEEFPADLAGLNVLFVDDISPYRTRKVRILNGAHTTMVPIGLLYGLNTVKEAVENETVGQLIQSALYDEIIPTLDLPESELKAFAKDVLDRFRNPYIKHYLKSIALNSTSKFETRVLPSILEYKKRLGCLPLKLVFALAGLFALYRERNNITMADNEEIIQMYDKAWKACGSSKEDYFKMVEKLLGQEQVWKTNLNRVEGLTEQVADYLYLIETEGMNKAVQTIL